MTIEQVVASAHHEGITTPAEIQQYALAKHGKALRLPSIRTAMSEMRRDGRIPPKERKPRVKV